MAFHVPRHVPTCRTAFALLLSVAISGITAQAYAANDYPSRPIRMIVPAAAGGATDVMARVLAKVLAEQNNVTVVVENKAGASGAIGMQATVAAAPDGYTVTLAVADAATVYPLLRKAPPYNVHKDLTPIAQVAYTNVFFCVPAETAYKSVKDFVQQTHQRKMAYGSNGYGGVSHLWAELFKQKTGATLLHVPYKGAAPAIQALASGEIDLQVASPASMAAQYAAGRIKPLVVTSAKRLLAYPDVPTMVESGYPDFVVGTWFGVLGPAHMPPAITDKLHTMINAAMQSAEYQKTAETFQFESTPQTRDQFTKMVSEDATGWQATIEAAGIKPED